MRAVRSVARRRWPSPPAASRVVAVDRNERGLRDLPDDIRREVADATDPAAATRLIDRIAGEIGPPDVLVNTIGAFRLETRSARLPRRCGSCSTSTWDPRCG